VTNPARVANRHGSAVITIPNDTDYVVTRKFDAPAQLVFRALTTPELVKRWWGFETSEWLVCEIDLRVGGRWRYVTMDEGQEVGFHGEYLEIEHPTRLVSTEAFEGVPDPDAVASTNTVTLEQAGGVTTMTVYVKLPSNEIREMIFATGMEGGMQVSYDRLEDLVREGAA
jgi:uncharacterized protein YndB with AHSA1/START domain